MDANLKNKLMRAILNEDHEIWNKESVFLPANVLEMLTSLEESVRGSRDSMISQYEKILVDDIRAVPEDREALIENHASSLFQLEEYVSKLIWFVRLRSLSDAGETPRPSSTNLSEVLRFIASDRKVDAAVLIVNEKDVYSSACMIREGTSWNIIGGIVGAAACLICKQITRELSANMCDPQNLDKYNQFIAKLREAIEIGITKGQEEGIKDQ